MPWAPGSATGIGSHPGTAPADALGVAFELPLPYLPELPARGPGADMLGRTMGLLVDMPVELYAARWQLTGRPGKDARRTADLWARDLDALTDAAEGYAGPLKLQAAGPWTLAASLQLPIGGAVLRDRGAVRDLVDSLTEGLRQHVAAVSARVPGADVLLQLDEPSLPAVLAGHIGTESGLGVFPAVHVPDATEALARLIAGVGAPVVVHCCAPDVPVALLRTAGAVGVALDLALLGDIDPLGEALDNGFGLLAGAAPALGRASAKAAADRIEDLWNKLGLRPADLPGQVVVTPACGLAGSTPEVAGATLRACAEAGRRLLER
ncbi:methionine synthase [Longispora sp. K20-0274]|uniref:methionine synthase n=1 Tax=Longispora sp. K20-0274 TaxID=3088255 RepID=UPI0039996B66